MTSSGTVLYLDGANYRTSNWLRYVNCARGQCEENILVSSSNGNIVLSRYHVIPIYDNILLTKLVVVNSAALIPVVFY